MVEARVLNGSDLRLSLMPACSEELWMAASISSLVVVPAE